MPWSDTQKISPHVPRGSSSRKSPQIEEVLSRRKVLRGLLESPRPPRLLGYHTGPGGDPPQQPLEAQAGGLGWVPLTGGHVDRIVERADSRGAETTGCPPQRPPTPRRGRAGRGSAVPPGGALRARLSHGTGAPRALPEPRVPAPRPPPPRTGTTFPIAPRGCERAPASKRLRGFRCPCPRPPPAQPQCL
ncbi:PREDICTED: basic proline-rich protein-like [Dipodomys ordii]|uniref:Basic proline-rich protein-like n=1 Tax=Dipodomys ordii TaxID=10020 RepID=A0A1S3EL95_DIPOR|nr:PREDICTED: basic proline-rich protein-like [Dipodomys ordii]